MVDELQPKTNWRKRDDKKLIKLAKKYRKEGFSVIVKHISGKTKNECKTRYNYLRQRQKEEKLKSKQSSHFSDLESSKIKKNDLKLKNEK